MIFIFSIPNDPSTNHVISWLNYNNSKWDRLNTFSLREFNDLSLYIDSNFNKINHFHNNEDFYRNLKSIWFRRTPETTYLENKSINNEQLNRELNKVCDNEIRALYSGILLFISKCKSLGNPFSNSICKINQLILASKLGLSIPETIITTNKHDLLNFKQKHSKIIIKPISNIAIHRIENENYSSYTRLFEDNHIINLSNNYFPCLVQKAIEKEFEIRSFYLNGKFYSMAIFSQKDSQTSIDFRVYNNDSPNRQVPFKLPEEIENKLTNFMCKLDLNTGSFDLIYSKTGEYIFLEVNPVGQFGMVSYPCNYFLEREIAKFLMEYE